MIELQPRTKIEKIGRSGLVIGKFYPPHNGHDYLIDSALSRVDDLSVFVIARPDESIPGDLRIQWLSENHPNANFFLRPDLINGIDSRRWAAQTKSWLGFTPDVVFTSETYGEPYAHFMGSRHVLVDQDRSVKPVSGTKIRNNPLENLDFLEPNVRAYFVKRVCVLGAESTGTTTLSRALARHYKTLWVPEYGRDYSERKMASDDKNWKSKDFEKIAIEQQRREDQMAGISDKILICDTNAFATEIWHERYMGKMSDKVGEIGQSAKADLYIVTDIDIPFVQDGIRDGQHIRSKMHKRFIDELRNRSLPYIVVSGKHKDRIRESVLAIDALMNKNFTY